MAGADLNGGFHDPARAPALGGIFLLAPELIQGKTSSQMCFCWAKSAPPLHGQRVPSAGEGAVSELEEFDCKRTDCMELRRKGEKISPQIPRGGWHQAKQSLTRVQHPLSVS